MLDEKFHSSEISAYESIGADSLAELPLSWKVTKLGSLLKPFSEKGHPDETLLSITREKGIIVRDREDEDANHNFIPDDLSGYKLVKAGQFGMNKMKAWQGSYGVSDHTGIVSPAYFIFDLNSKVVASFFHWAIRSKLYVSFFGQASDGVRVGQWDLSQTRMRQIPFLHPPKKEQTAIANFLDDKTEKIDRAIAIKEAQIARLEERKQILIQTAVTRGLDPNVPMKDSGIDWIGEIPAHWKVEKLFGLSRFVRGNSAFAKDELLSNGKYVALQYGKTYKVDEIDDTYEFYVNEEFYKESQEVNFGDVILISTSETIEDLGHSAIYSRGEVGLIGGEQLLIKPNKYFLDHYYLYYSTKVFSKQLRKYATGIKVFRFNINDLKSIYMAVPPKEEQRKIVQYLSAQSMKIGQTKSLLETQIAHLREYRASLINAAVTGKIKVTS